MRGRAVDLGADARSRPHQRSHFRRDGEHVADRRAGLEAGRQPDHRDAVAPGRIGELPTGGGDDSPGAQRLGRLVAGDRLLGVAGVAGAEHGPVGQHGRGQLVAALGGQRPAEAAAEGDRGQVAADRRAAHAADDQAAGGVERLEPRRLDPPQRVRQVVREREYVIELVGPIGRSNLGQSVACAHDATSPGPRRAPSPIATPASIRAPSPITAPASTRAPSPTSTRGARIASWTLACGPIRAVAQHHRAGDRRPLADLAPVADHGPGADRRPCPHRDLGLEQRRRIDARAGIHLRSVLDQQPGAVEARGGGGLHAALEDVPACLQVALGGADVHPVTLQPVTVQPLAHQVREDLPLDRDHLAWRDRVDHAALEHVGAGVDLVGVDLAGVRLLQELEHLALGARRGDARRRWPAGAPDQAVGARVLDRVERQRGHRPALLVRADQRAQVEVGEQVAVQDQEAVAQQPLVGRQAQRARGAQRLGAPRRSGSAGLARRPRRAPRAAASAPKPHAITTSVTPWRATQSTM